MSLLQVIGEIMNTFSPDAIVLQCGSDSLSGDRLGCFNLSVKGHGEAVNFCKSLGVPLMLLGGKKIAIQVTTRRRIYLKKRAQSLDL
jgi:histone deacetylase 1/2